MKKTQSGYSASEKVQSTRDQLISRNDTFQYTLDKLAPSQIYPADVVLFQQGALAREVYFLDSGLVKYSHIIRRGREFIVDLRFPGSLLGIASVIVQKPYPVAAITLTQCRLRRIAATDFISSIRLDSSFSWSVQQMQCYELYNEVARIVQLGSLSAQDRVEHLLWQLNSVMSLNQKGKEIRLRLLLKRWEISQMVGITPQYLSKLLKHMEEDGIIRQEKGWIVIPDLERLYHQTGF